MKLTNTLLAKPEPAILVEQILDADKWKGLYPRISERLRSKLRRCVEDCPLAHLTHLALGTQDLAVSIRRDGLDFDVRLRNDRYHGLPDPWAPRAWYAFLLPDIPVLDDDCVSDLVVEMANLSGRTELDSVWFDGPATTDEAVLEHAASSAEATGELRRRVWASFECRYLPSLKDVPEAVLHHMHDRLEANAGASERRRIRSKARRAAAKHGSFSCKA